MTYDVENLTDHHVRAGGWVFPPKHVQRGMPSLPPGILAESKKPNAELRVTEHQEVVPIVIPDLDGVDTAG
jgi:hypothetical protein